jgi:hypothetical protein
MFIVVLSFIVGKTGVPDSAAKNGYFFVVLSTPWMSGIRTHNVSIDRK